MVRIMLRLRSLNRFRAFGLHLLASAAVALLSAALVFLLWYPGLLAFASGVATIFLILLAVDVTLGPVITLIIFNPKKKELKRDLVIVVVIQLSALLYGLHTVFIARPVYLAFNEKRFDLVYANEVSDQNLAKAIQPEYMSLPYFGPKIIAAPLPNDPKIVEEIVYGAIAGGDDVQHMPKYYVPYAEQKLAVMKQIRPLSDLKLHNKDRPQEVDTLIKQYTDTYQDVGYLPLKAKANDLVVIVSRTTGEVLEMSKLKPWVNYVPQYVPIKR